MKCCSDPHIEAFSRRKENKGKYKTNKGEGKKLHSELQEAFKSNASDSTLTDLHNKIKTVRNTRMDRKFNKMMSIRSVLNETQRKNFFELHQEMKKGRRGN